MNRRLLWILAVLAVIALAVFVVWARLDSQAPRFVPGTPASITPGGGEQYDFLADVPFENDSMWIWTDIGHNHRPQLVLYDLRRKKILGQLFNAGMPNLRSRDGSRLLVTGFGTHESFTDSLANLLKVILKLPKLSRRTETFWILDTLRNSAKRVGSLSQFTGAGSTWYPSPDFRYGYTVPSTSMRPALCLFDLEQQFMTRTSIPGYPCGWWDEHDILIDMGNNQFDLLDVRTQSTRSLFSAADFEKPQANSAITNIPPLGTIANWNGKSFDFYFGVRDQINGLKGSNSFVLRASVDSPKLELLYPQFRFRWGGHFDHNGKQYLYHGESGLPGRGGNGAVYLQDLTSGAVSTIVPPNDRGRYALPQFYGNEVIYLRDNHLHRVGLDGSNDAFVFPTEGK